MRVEMRRMLSGRGFWLAVLLGMAALLAGTAFPKLEEPLKPGTTLALVKEACCSKPAYFLLPAAAVLPWSDSFLTEYRSGFLKACLPRLGRRRYVEQKLLAVSFGGALAWSAAGLLLFALYALVFFPMEKKGVAELSVVFEAAAVLGRSALTASVLSSLGGICGALSGSGYLAFGIPFTAYYFCMILQERYFPDALWLYPPQWIAGTAQWGSGGRGLWVFLLLFAAVSATAHGGVLHAKIAQLQ